MTILGKPPKLKPTGPMRAGLPTYTKAQFQAVRPGGSYAAYIKYIDKRRGNVPGKPAWPGSGGPGLPTLMSMMQNMRFETPAQIEARAGRMTAAQIAAQRGLAADAAKQANADALRASKAMSEAGQVAAGMNKGLFGAVGGEYNSAARELANLGTGTVGAASAATDRDVAATNEALARVGAPVIQPGAMAGPQQAGVQSYLGAGLPGMEMVHQGQAAEFGLAGMVNAAQLRSTQEAAAALSQSTREIGEKRQAAYAEIARGRPELAAKILSDLQTAERQNVALGMSLLEARRGALQTGFEQGVTKQEIQIKKDTLKAEAAAAAAAAKAAAKENDIEYGRIDAAASKAAGVLIDRAGRPILDKNGQPIPVAATAGKPTAKIPGLTPNQAQKQIDKAAEMIPTFLFGYKIDAKGKRVPANETDDPNTTMGTVDYWPALKRLRQLGLPTALAQSMLDDQFERGEAGRPLFNLAEQKAIKKKLNATYGAQRAKTYWNFHVGKINRLFDSDDDASIDEAERMLNGMLGLARG